MAIEDFIKVLGIGKLGLPAGEEQEAPLPEVAGSYKLPGLSEEELSSLPYQERPDFQASIAPGESAGIPQKTGKRNDILSSLSGLMGKTLSSEEAPAEVPSAPVEAMPYQKQDLMGSYGSDLDRALADRQSRMNRTAFNAGITDFIAAGNRALGLKDDRRDTGAAELKRMEDIELKDFNERMGLSGKVLGSRKAEQDLSNMGDLNDPNSPITQALRKGAKEYLGGKIDDSVLNSLSGQQLAQLNDELGGVFSKIEDRKLREQEMKWRQEDRREAREDRAEARREKNKEKDPLGLNLTPGEKKADEKFAQTTLQKWAREGHREIILSDIDKLKEAERILETQNVTGSIKGRLPFQETTNPEGKRLKDLVDAVTQKNLREILGGQFAKVEGEQLLSRGLDTAVNESDNLERVRSLRKSLEAAAKAKDASVEHFETKGSLKGLKTDFSERQPQSETKASTSYNANQEAGIKYIMDLKKVSRDQAISALKKAGKL